MLNYFLPPHIQKTVLLVFTLSIFLSFNAFASTIKLMSGKILENEITFRDDELIKVNSGFGIDITYYLDEIQSIDGKILTPEAIKVNNAVKRIEPIEESTGPVIDETVTELEPISIEKRVKETESIHPIAKTKPAEDIHVIEQQVQAKESPSPFGPTIRGNKSVSNSASSDIRKVEISLPEAEIMKDHEAVAVAINKKSLASTAVSKAKYFRMDQENNFRKVKDQFQKKLLFVQEKLNDIPVKIRRDILGVLSLVFIFFYAVICFPLMWIAKKLKRKRTWIVWVPILQIFYFIYIAKRPLWLSVFFLIPVINIILALILFIFILRELKRSYWLIVLTAVPGVNIFVLWHLAISEINNN